LLTREVAEVTAADMEQLTVGGIREETWLQTAEGTRLVRPIAELVRWCLCGAGAFVAGHVGTYLRAADVRDGAQNVVPHVGTDHQPVAALTVRTRRFTSTCWSSAGSPAIGRRRC
jgi:hypothetical protein